MDRLYFFHSSVSTLDFKSDGTSYITLTEPGVRKYRL